MSAAAHCRRLSLPCPRLRGPALRKFYVAGRDLIVIPGRGVSSSALLAEPSREFYYNYMIDWSSCPAVERDPQRVSGAWVFRGTRVPVAALFQNLEDGAQLSEFLEWFPGVDREQARTVLEHASQSLDAA